MNIAQYIISLFSRSNKLSIQKHSLLTRDGNGKIQPSLMQSKARPASQFRETLLHSTSQNTAKFALRSHYHQEQSNAQGEFAHPLPFAALDRRSVPPRKPYRPPCNARFLKMVIIFGIIYT